MQLSKLKNLLDQHPDAALAFTLPNGTEVAQHFHVTEVGRVRKDFIDCGGVVRSTDACVLQVWVAHDIEHRLKAAKLGQIIGFAKDILHDADLPIEIEYDISVITQFTVTSVESNDERITLTLASKHTACLAPDRCGIDGCAEDDDCCDTPAPTEGQEGSVMSLGVNQPKCC